MQQRIGLQGDRHQLAEKVGARLSWGGEGAESGFPVSNLGKRQGSQQAFSSRGQASKAFCPSTNFFVLAPSDGDWLRAQMMRQESPLQYSGWEGGGEEKRWLGGFPDSLTS